MDTDGSNYSGLHYFGGGAADGWLPLGGLTLDSGKLYGVTYSGGDSDLGTVFSIDTDGTNFTLLHEFAGGLNDGSGPDGSLTLDSGKLYGTTSGGGDSDIGTIFSLDTDGSNFTLLHEFAGGAEDGDWPRGNLIPDSGKLYGMTGYGGDYDEGTIFSMDTDGSDFTLLCEFSGGSNDGGNPSGSLILESGRLYGMTQESSSMENLGEIYSIGTDGSNFAVLHKFTGEDGVAPSGLTLDSGKLYGTTSMGGSAWDYPLGLGYGTVFVIPIPLLGDADHDGLVSADDYASVQANFGNTGDPGILGDANWDGMVSADDFTSIQAYFGNHAPEPATLGLLVLGGLALLRRRRLV